MYMYISVILRSNASSFFVHILLVPILLRSSQCWIVACHTVRLISYFCLRDVGAFIRRIQISEFDFTCGLDYVYTLKISGIGIAWRNGTSLNSERFSMLSGRYISRKQNLFETIAQYPFES